jgi:S-methylmethionine-dependent homocysteine/selenocysteine methylase
VILDGATGTELERAGIATGLPLWSTHALLEAPEAVAEIHARYLRAGAELITANTFRTQRRTLARAGLAAEDRALTGRAVALARAAVDEHAGGSAAGCGTRWVAGSLPPLEDCYRPELVAPANDLDREHGRQAELLAEAGVDLILVETMNSRLEAVHAGRAAARVGLPFAVGLVSWEPGSLLSGDSLLATAESVLELGAVAVGVNCVPPSSLEASLRLLAGRGLPLLVSPNLGEPNDLNGFTRREDLTPAELVLCLEAWLAEPWLRIVGGCCGTTPRHLAALARRVAS